MSFAFHKADLNLVGPRNNQKCWLVQHHGYPHSHFDTNSAANRIFVLFKLLDSPRFRRKKNSDKSLGISMCENESSAMSYGLRAWGLWQRKQNRRDIKSGPVSCKLAFRPIDFHQKMCPTLPWTRRNRWHCLSSLSQERNEGLSAPQNCEGQGFKEGRFKPCREKGWQHHEISCLELARRLEKTLTRDDPSEKLFRASMGCMKSFLVLNISMWHPKRMPALKPNSKKKYQKRTNIPQWRNIFKEDAVIKIPQKYFPTNSRPKL